jgi:hypothetical protein
MSYVDVPCDTVYYLRLMEVRYGLQPGYLKTMEKEMKTKQLGDTFASYFQLLFDRDTDARHDIFVSLN